MDNLLRASQEITKLIIKREMATERVLLNMNIAQFTKHQFATKLKKSMRKKLFSKQIFKLAKELPIQVK